MMVIKVGSLKIEVKDEAMFSKGSKSKHATNTKKTCKQGLRMVKVENQNPRRSDCVIYLRN